MKQYPVLLGCLWSLFKWFVGLTVFIVAADVLKMALGVGRFWTGALIAAFVVAGYWAGRMDAGRVEEKTDARP